MKCGGYENVQGRGFTIVELLVVIVVIGILVTVVAVSYSGLTRDARLVALKTDLSSSASQLELYAWNNDSYPSDLEEAELPASEGTTYQYRYNTSNYTYCLTGVNAANESWFLDNSNSTPRKGACPGHGVNGGGTVTNLVKDPQAGYSWNYGYGTGGVGTASVVSDSRFPGGSAFQLSWSTGPSNANALWIGHTEPISAQVGQTYFISVRYATSWVGAAPWFYFGGANTATGPTSIVDRGDGTKEARTSITATAAYTNFNVSLTLGGNPMPIAGSTLRVGGFMVSKRPTDHPYGDGSSPGWAWNGTPNNSTSVGPEL